MTEASFKWHDPNAITTLVGSALTRSPDPVHLILRKREPGYLDEVINYIKQVCVYTESDSYVIQSTSGELKRLFDTSTRSVLHRFSDTMHSIVDHNWTPRKHKFLIDTLIDSIDLDSLNLEQFKFYQLSKLHEFYVNPPEYFQTPFSIGTDPKSGALALHPGNFRLLSTLFLPEDIPCCIMFRINNQLCKKYFARVINDPGTVLSMDNDSLLHIFNLQLCRTLPTIRYSSITGIQIVELSSELQEFKKDYEIEWTGRHFVVNNIIVATLKNGIFVPPEPAR